MNRSRLVRILAATGAAILVLGGAAVRFVITPALLELPANLDTTVRLSGTASMLDQAAIRSGDLAGAIRSDVPVTVMNRVHVQAATGDSAIVTSESTVVGADDAPLQSATHTWAVNRRTLYPAPVPPGSGAEPHDGLVVGFPLPPQPHDYPWWDPSTQTTTTARYRDTEAYHGRECYVYQVDASGPVKDPTIVASIPARPVLGLVATSATTFWVDTATSYVLKVDQSTRVTVSLGGFALPVTVFALSAQYTPESADTMLRGAQTAGHELDLLQTILPATLLGAGVIAVAIAIRLPRRRSR
ncbi:MAG TPA: porin PorA family protein [Rugosimonospora sp.]|nr:porin PorA family protein [Rugosimonospora sp.]